MSIKAISWALSVKTGSPVAKLVLIKLADNANDEGACWPSIRHIAEQTELSDRSIREHIKTLESLGFLTVEKRYSEGVRLPNVYHLNLRQTVGVVRDMQGGAAPDSPGVVQEAQGNKPSKINRQLTFSSSADAEPYSKPKKTRIPEGCPSERGSLNALAFWTLKHRPDLCERLADISAKFRAHHLSKGTRMENWEQAWVTWYSNALEFESRNRNGNGNARLSPHEKFARAGLSIILDSERQGEDPSNYDDACEAQRPLLAT